MKFRQAIISIQLVLSIVFLSCGRSNMWSNAEEVGVKIPRISIIYNANASTGGDVPVDYLSYKTGSIITIADNTSYLVKSGYSFTGWNTKPDGTGVTYTVGQHLAAATTDITLYARWTTNPVYTISFNGNGATGGNVPVYYTSYEPGQSAAVPGNPGSLARPGYKFTGWNTAYDGSGTTYTQSQLFTMSAASVTLYAMWTVSETYTVTYNANGADSGSVPVDSTNYIYGQSAYALANTGNLARTGYPFGGWNTMPDGSGTDYASGAPVTMTGNIVLYAKWVTYALGDTGPGGGLICYINPNYVSDGWRYLEAAPSDQSSGIQWYNGISIDTGAGATDIGTGKINTSKIVSIQGTGSYAAKLCDDLSLSGYNDWFLPSRDELNCMYTNLKAYGLGGFTDIEYWSSSEWGIYGASAQRINFTNGYADNLSKNGLMRLRAVRAFRSMNPTYVIVYISNGATGGSVPSNTYHYEQGQTVTIANNTGSLVKTGCTFIGWNTAADGSGTDYAPETTTVMGTDNIVLYARWSLPLTWDDNTEPGAVSHVQNTSVRVEWSHLQNAVKYEIWYVTSTNPSVVETKFDETVNNYYISTQHLDQAWRIKAIDSSDSVIDTRIIDIIEANDIPTLITGTYTDDFEDGIISSNYYIRNQSQASEDSGYLKLNLNVTDNGPILYLGYDTEGKRYIHLQVKWYQHRSNDNYYGTLMFYAYRNSLDWISMANNHDTYYGYYGTAVSHQSYNEQIYLPTNNVRDALDATEYFDTWFTWDVYIDSTTGLTEVKINSISLGTSSTGIILKDKFILRIDSSQWFTGAYVWLDDLLIESSDTPY
jgi:uncharacterized repeat protein (TIGR02543 family)